MNESLLVSKETLRAGAEQAEFQPKIFRALGLDLTTASAPLPADATALEVLAAALAEQHRKLLDHDPGTRLGTDAEDLHQMRVATRRARAFLRVSKPLLDPTWTDELRAELDWLGSVLGCAGPRRPPRTYAERDIEAGRRRSHGSRPRHQSRASAPPGTVEGRGSVVRTALSRARRSAGRAASARVHGNEPAAGRALVGRVRASEKEVCPPRRQLARRGAARGSDQGEACPLRRGARGERARESRRTLRGRGEDRSGCARRAPGRGGRRGAHSHVVGRQA